MRKFFYFLSKRYLTDFIFHPAFKYPHAGKTIQTKINIILSIFLITILLACSSSSSSSSSPAGGGIAATPPEEYEYGLQDSTVFDPSSGRVVFLGVTDSKGYTWTLLVPSDALLTKETITMTALEAKDLGTNIRSGVKLEPDGLYFSDAVMLSCELPDSVSNPEVSLIFNLKTDGSFASFTPTDNSSYNSKTIARAQIFHFSSYGNDNSTESSDEVMNQYKKLAQEDYTNAMAAAKLFVKGPTPTPPVPPQISQFCRCTEVNPENGESYEYTRNFISPYEDMITVLLSTMRALNLLSPEVDTSDGWTMAESVVSKAKKSIYEVGENYKGEKPPDRLPAVIATALLVERWLALVSTSTSSAGWDIKLTTYAMLLRNYYLDELKNNHDYRAFPILLTLEKTAQLLSGTDRLNDIMDAMTFGVVINTSFEATWLTSGKLLSNGNVKQDANVKDIKNELDPPDFLWGTGDNRVLASTEGNYNTYNPDGSLRTTVPLTGQSNTGSLWLMNWDACVTKSFDVKLSSFYGTNESTTVAGPAAFHSLKDYWWLGAGGFIFTIPMTNLNPALGNQTFSGSGTAAEGNFKSSAEIGIWIVHTPK